MLIEKNFDSQELTIHELQRRIAVYEDETAYKELFLQLGEPLKRFASTIVKSRELAEEIVSDIFVEIWVRRSSLEEIADLKMYLYISARNGALRKLQQTKKNATLSLDDFDVQLVSTINNPEEDFLTSELLQRIDAAINELPPRCKIIYKLAKEDKLKYKEIAQILNINVKTIDNQLATALRKIATAINFRLNKSTTT